MSGSFDRDGDPTVASEAVARRLRTRCRQGVVGRLGELDGDRRRITGSEEDEDLLAHLGHHVALPRHVGEGAGEVEGERLERVEGLARPSPHARASQREVTPLPQAALTSTDHDRFRDRRTTNTTDEPTQATPGDGRCRPRGRRPLGRADHRLRPAGRRRHHHHDDADGDRGHHHAAVGSPRPSTVS